MSFFLFEPLTGAKKYGIIISKYSGIYNIPIIPLIITSTIFPKRKQEVRGRATDAQVPTKCNILVCNDASGITKV